MVTKHRKECVKNSGNKLTKANKLHILKEKLDKYDKIVVHSFSRTVFFFLYNFTTQ